MAFQRPFLISLKRSDSQHPWGFRVFGGKEYGEPHTVEKIFPDSLAERCGLREGDEIIQVGRVNVQDMTFGQVQEVISRCGNRVEMFVIREDLLTPRKGQEPPVVKAIVHNPYNSPLSLYSPENIADTLATQAAVLTDGHIPGIEEEESPENLTFKQKSAVFQLLEEQAKQESLPQQYSRSSPQKKVAPPPPPPKPKPPAPFYRSEEPQFASVHQQQQRAEVQQYQQRVEVQTHQQQRPVAKQQQRHTTTAVITPTRAYPSADPFASQSQFHQQTTNYQVQQTGFSSPVANHHHTQPTVEHTVSFKIGPPPPPRSSSQNQPKMATVQRQQQQQYHQQVYKQYEQQQYEQQQQYQQEPHSYLPQQSQQGEYQVSRHQDAYRPTTQYKQQTVQYQPQEERESIFEQTPTTPPMTYKAPPPQKYQVAWPPPPNDTGRLASPGSAPDSPSFNRRQMGSVWPPKQPTVRELPRVGFNTTVLREEGIGRRLIWPPPKSEDEFRSGRTTPQSPTTGRRINWNPSPSPPLTRRSPFGSISPQTRRKDIQWPPLQPGANKENILRPSPKLGRKSGRFEDHIKQQASHNVPTTYRPPPGCHRSEYR